MKTGKPSLYPNDAVAEAVTEYSEAHSLALPQHLLDYHAEIFKSSPTSNLMISTFQAQALVFLARMIGAKRGECTISFHTQVYGARWSPPGPSI